MIPSRSIAKPRRWAEAPWLMLLAGIVALFLFPYLFLGRSMLPLELMAVFQPWARHAAELWGTVPPVYNPLLDALQQYYPRRVTMTQALHAGWLPLWNPGVYGGSPFLAAQQGAVLYPPAWLLTLFAPEMQFGWSAFFHLWLAAAGSYLFLRRLALRPVAAVTGAVAFALNGFVVVWLAYPNVTQWTLCWLPLALYLWERGRERDDLRWIAGCGAALALSLLGGHGQSSAYVLLTWGAWALFRSLGSPRPARAVGRWVALPAALAVGLALGHLLPALEFTPRTDRGGRVPWPAAAAAGMPLSQLWTFLLPRLFGDGTLAYAQSSWLPADGKAGLAFIERSFYPGASVLVLAAGAWAARRGPAEHRRLALFSLALTAAAVLLASGTPLYWPLWRLAPGFGQFTAIARILCVAGWSLACLAALGVHAITDPDPAARADAARAIGIAAAAGAVLALIGHFIYGGAAPAHVAATLARLGRPSADLLASRELRNALLALIVPAVLAGLAAAPGARGAGILQPVAAGGLAALAVAADLFAFGVRFNPAADPRLARSSTPELAALQAQTEPFRFLSVGPPGRQMELRQRMPSNLPSVYGLLDLSGSDSFVLRRYREWAAALQRSAGGAAWPPPGAPSLRAAGVRYYLTGSKELFAGLRPVVDAALQEDRGALPYARLHTRVQALPNPEALLEALARPDRSPLVALAAGPEATDYDGPARVIPFRARRVNGNRLLLEGTAPTRGLLVVCEQFDPGWRAWIDGAPARIVPAEHLFVGVPVEAGRHTIELRYAPDSFRVGAFGTLLAVAALSALFVGSRERQEP